VDVFNSVIRIFWLKKKARSLGTSIPQPLVEDLSKEKVGWEREEVLATNHGLSHADRHQEMSASKNKKEIVQTCIAKDHHFINANINIYTKDMTDCHLEKEFNAMITYITLHN
jgi:hypothetical protein